MAVEWGGKEMEGSFLQKYQQSHLWQQIAEMYITVLTKFSQLVTYEKVDGVSLPFWDFLKVDKILQGEVHANGLTPGRAHQFLKEIQRIGRIDRHDEFLLLPGVKENSKGLLEGVSVDFNE